jgi:hypothetical protein
MASGSVNCHCYDGLMLGTEWIRSTKADLFQRLINVSSKDIGHSQADQPAQGPFTVGSRSIESYWS